ncbi:MAG: ABC transporter substrate-binding protein [Coxiellaceae bacterium]|nr:ABC transporter substrate-binding protein [Coxiellaceae bacterium]
MKNNIKVISLCALTALSTCIFATPKPVTTIGIVVPVELPAMKQIVSGFEDTLTKESKTPVKFIVKNAQGDANIERSIMQQFSGDSVNIVAPIGTDAAQMAISMIRNKPIIGIAADHLKENAKKANNLNVTGVNSQTPPSERFQLIHEVLPNLKKITIVYSTDSRIFAQVNQVIAAAKKDHIAVQKLMVTQLSDLYTLGHNIDADSQGIFILKDELVVSGINTLLQQAAQKKIPVISSDDGSVAKGAAFALGVSEYQTGVSAANVTLKIMNGAKAADLPVHIMKHYFVFLNPASAKAQNINVDAVKAAAKKLNYSLTIL